MFTTFAKFNWFWIGLVCFLMSLIWRSWCRFLLRFSSIYKIVEGCYCYALVLLVFTRVELEPIGLGFYCYFDRFIKPFKAVTILPSFTCFYWTWWPCYWAKLEPIVLGFCCYFHLLNKWFKVVAFLPSFTVFFLLDLVSFLVHFYIDCLCRVKLAFTELNLNQLLCVVNVFVILL